MEEEKKKSRKLYIFGIGGTGARVLKALTMLLASGCKLNEEFDTVIPIIIDPDTSNGDVNRTRDILKLYQEIRNQINKPDDFFAQEIKTVSQLHNNSSTVDSEYFQFHLNNIGQNTFKQYIGFDTLNDNYKNAKDDRNFTRLLYSDKNLSSDLSVGFKGNPNMGAIVLNQFIHSDDFKLFGKTFGDNDAVFIISSIFGGTGAAGFPLLLKNLSESKSPKIKDAPIGAITYLPYFAISKKDEKDEIDSESFEDKAKIAIDYYNRTIIEQRKVSSMYFIGNKGNTNYFEYAVGGKAQRNKAHFLEMAGALAIFDFCENIDIKKPDNKTLVKEFGIEKTSKDSTAICFGDLDRKNQKEIAMPLTKYKLFSAYLEIGLPKALNVSRWTKDNIQLVKKNENSSLHERYFNAPEYKLQIKAFNNHFREWLKEMGENKPAFSPYNEINWEDALSLVKGDKGKGNKSFKSIDVENCKLITDIDFKSTSEKKHTTLIKVFGKSIENVLKKNKLLEQD